LWKLPSQRRIRAQRRRGSGLELVRQITRVLVAKHGLEFGLRLLDFEIAIVRSGVGVGEPTKRISDPPVLERIQAVLELKDRVGKAAHGVGLDSPAGVLTSLQIALPLVKGNRIGPEF
jgi:hypothetical protein